MATKSQPYHTESKIYKIAISDSLDTLPTVIKIWENQLNFKTATDE